MKVSSRPTGDSEVTTPRLDQPLSVPVSLPAPTVPVPTDPAPSTLPVPTSAATTLPLPVLSTPPPSASGPATGAGAPSEPPTRKMRKKPDQGK